jgi:ketose-bisphosphate aldolase
MSAAKTPGKPALIVDIQTCINSRKVLLSVNVFDYISFRALALSFASASRPVIAQFSARIFQQYDPGEIVAWRAALGFRHLWLHLDHCHDVSLVQRCAHAGFDAVMFDGSRLPLNENIRASRSALRAVKRIAPDVLVECEIGHVHGVEDGFGRKKKDKNNLQLEDVLKFHAQVVPDLLAVGFGNMHGHYQGNEIFDLKLMRAVGQALPHVPLVLHGGSGMTLPLVRRLIQWGHCKLNISTDLKQYWMNMLNDLSSVRPELDSPVATTQYMRIQLERFFIQLQRKYNSCLL